MRSPALLGLTLLLLGLIASPAFAYPAYDGPVVNSGAAFSEGQVAGLQLQLKQLEEELEIRGTILALPAQGTWDLQGFSNRVLLEWQAQGVVGDRSFLLILVPSQNRMALTLDAALTEKLDPWTAAQLTERLAVQCEEGQLYLASQALITQLQQAPELKPVNPRARQITWSWVIFGSLIIIGTAWRTWFKWQQKQKEQL